MCMPLIIQKDSKMLLETAHPLFNEIKDSIIAFSELLESPDYVYTYKITPLSVWTALANGYTKTYILSTLTKYSRFEIPCEIIDKINECCAKYGAFTLETFNNQYVLKTKSSIPKNVYDYLDSLSLQKTSEGYLLTKEYRGEIKSSLLKLGYPVNDLAGFSKGEALAIEVTDIKTREYQDYATDNFINSGTGTVVLPCGSGKTVIGIKAITTLKTHTLIITNCNSSARQWRKELLKRTNIKEDQVSLYSSKSKTVAPITITTYQMITYRKRKNDIFKHFEILNNNKWGLVIYDEVHIMPAITFRIAASLQSIRRLGLTATLVREDHKETDIFSLIGPKRFDKPWKDLEQLGYLASLKCIEVRVALDEDTKQEYLKEENQNTKFEIASKNKNKKVSLKSILDKHKNEKILIIGYFIDQLYDIQSSIGAPIITGSTPYDEREKLLNDFRENKINILILSKIGNSAIDLPDANVMIQISFQYGSRNEEAQRAGRVTRPKEAQSYFYTLVSKDTVEQNYTHNRQLFLVNQGYSYLIQNAA